MSEAPGPRSDQLRMSAVRQALLTDRVMAIVRYRDGGDLFAAVEALLSGGIRVLELTTDTPGVWEAIAACSGRAGVCIGAGTVTTVDQVSHLARAGGSFIVSPGTDELVIRAALDAGLLPLPGVATGTDVLAGLRAGAGIVKLFPAGALGSRYLTELRGPFAHLPFVATGGIDCAQVPEWLSAGAAAVALGSDLAGRTAPRTADEAAALTDRARRVLSAATTR